MRTQTTKIRLSILALIAFAVTVSAFPATAAARLPAGFFGIGPQTALTQTDTDRMARGGIESMRVPIPWSAIQKTPARVYDWEGLDEVVEQATRSGLEIFPFLYSTPRWAAATETVLPVQNSLQRRSWAAFLSAIVSRYGANGAFWAEHSPASAEPLNPMPIRHWQIWNEANFFYFATPASPTIYAKLLKQSAPVIRRRDRGAKVILTGLFGLPNPKPPKARDATEFLDLLYGVRGIKSFFDGVALHPYADDVETLKEIVSDFRGVVDDNRDSKVGLYITEMGWGSQANSPVSFEKGVRGQVQQLTGAYKYLIANQKRLHLQRVYWFSWKDNPPLCSFCDSVGLFRGGTDFIPKPSWFAFVKLTGGDPSAPPGPPPPPDPDPPPPCPFPPLPC